MGVRGRCKTGILEANTSKTVAVKMVKLSEKKDAYRKSEKTSV